MTQIRIIGADICVIGIIIHMKMEELRKKDISELNKMKLDSRKKLIDLRFKFAANQLKNTKEISNTKKEIARILTILKETNTKKQ